MTIAVTILDRATLHAIRTRVFRTRETTIAAESWRYGLAEYEDAIASMRRQLRDVLERLPDVAYEVPIATLRPMKSAGEVVGRLRHTQMNVLLPVARAVAHLPLGREASGPRSDNTYPALSRIGALFALDDADRDLAHLFRLIPLNVDFTDTLSDPNLGVVGLLDVLLLLAINEDDHLSQIETLHDTTWDTV